MVVTKERHTPFVLYNTDKSYKIWIVLIEKESSGCFPHFDKLLKKGIWRNLLSIHYKMKQIHELFYEPTHSDCFREIMQLSTLNRVLLSSIPSFLNRSVCPLMVPSWEPITTTYQIKRLQNWVWCIKQNNFAWLWSLTTF